MTPGRAAEALIELLNTLAVTDLVERLSDANLRDLYAKVLIRAGELLEAARAGRQP